MMRQYELVDRVRRYNSHADEDLLDRAYVYAMKAHGAQKRASGDPYFSHPLEVAAILTDLKLDDATIVAAVLHDTIEDTDSTREEIDKLFGPDIGRLVEGLTKLKRLDLVSKRAVQAENFRKLLLAIADDVRVLLVKLADRLHNMRTLQFMPAEKQARIAEETLDIYAPLAGRMGMQNMRDELEELAFRHLMPEAAATIKKRLDDLREKNGKIIASVEQELRDELVDARHRGHRRRTPKTALFGLAQDGAQIDRLRTIVGHLRLSRRRQHGRGLLRRDRRRPHQMADRARTLQGLYLDAEGKRLSLDPHDRRRARTAARRTSGAHPRDARHRPLRHRRACALQGWASRRPRGADAREPRLSMAAAHDRASGRRRFAGGISRAYEARTVSRSGLLLHAERPADRSAARRDADRFRLCGPHRRRQFRRRRQDQRSARAARLSNCRTATRSRSCAPRARFRRRFGRAGHDRQGARGDPAGDARCGAGAIYGPRPADRDAGLRAGGQVLWRRQAESRSAASGASQRSTMCWRRSAAARFFPATSSRPSIPNSRKSARPARTPRPEGETGWFGLPKAASLVFKVPGAQRRGGANSDPWPARRSAGALSRRTAAPCRETASSAS